jgi:hypothetical protein
MENYLMEKIGMYLAGLESIKAREEAIKSDKAKLSEIEAELIEAMETYDMKSIRTTDGVLVTSVATAYPRIIAEQKGEAYQWLKERGYYDDLATINGNTIKGWLKARLEAGEEVPPGTEMFIKNSISVRRR